jgi:acyl-CoA synthetase (AMP-forming)/AMP-acid ligase II
MPSPIPLPEIHAAWNSPALAEAILRAWEEDRPIALFNPVLMELPGVGGWIRGLGPGLGEGLPTGFQAILLTSGTTGQPRLVALGRESVTWNAETLARHLQLPEGRLVTHLTIPLFHAFGLVLGLFMTRLQGGTTLLPERGLGLMDALLASPTASDAHSLLLLVPAMVRSLPEVSALAPELRARLAKFKGTSITGGAPVRQEDLRKLTGLFPNMIHTVGYGLTEAGPALTHTSGEIPLEDSAIGTPLPGVQLIPPEGETAENSGWMFRSPGTASAILQAGSRTWQPVRSGDLIPTGDLLARLPDTGGDGGGYWFRGRTAWVFKKKGETVSPVWIEDALWAALRKAPGTDAGSEADGHGAEGALTLPADGLVLAPDATAPSESIVLYVESSPEPNMARWIEAGIRGLPSFVRPDRIIWLPRFPRNALGKVERGALRATRDSAGPRHD